MGQDSDEGRDLSERTSIITHPFQEAADPSSGAIWKWPRRYLVAAMAFLGFCNVYALRVNLSVAIVAMTSPTVQVINGTKITVPPEFEWTDPIKGLILSSFFYGYILPQIPAGFYAAKFGGKRLFGFGLGATSILTIFTPVFARTSLYLLVAARVLEGLFEGVTYPAMHATWARWAPPLERSKLATFAFSGSYVGTVIAFPVSGLLAESFGWPSIFVFFGVVSLIWVVVWFSVVSETPSTDKHVTESEMDLIRTSLGSAATNVKVNTDVPWKRMFTSFPVWAIIIAHFCENWGFYTLLVELPTYMKDVYSFDLHKSGLLSAIPYLAMGIMVQLGGYLADVLRSHGKFTTTKVRKIFNCGGFVLQTVFLLGAAHSNGPSQFIVCLTIAVAFGGFAWSGFGVNHLDIAPPFSSILMGISNTFATLPGIISPILIGHMVNTKVADHASDWQSVFYVTAVIYLIGAIMYGLFANGDEQTWARIHSDLLIDSDTSDTEDLPYGQANCD